MRNLTIIVTFTLAMFNGGAVLAQTLPRTSPSEQQYEGINRSIQQEELGLEQNQQNQFNNQMLLNQEDRNVRNFPSTVPGRRRGTCPSGSVGC